LDLHRNVGLFSQYVFRGMSQTNEKPAVQGGFDLAHKSGFLRGNWASNISWDQRWILDSAESGPAGSSASVEWDFLRRLQGTLPMDFATTSGILYYYYPGSYPGRLHEARHHGAIRRALVEVAVVQVQLERERQDVRLPDSRGSQ
jgi:uncharacterized protein (TIGR02001 family)